MISPLQLPIDVEKDMPGIILEHIKPAPKEGEELKLYIPMLMTKITKGKPKTHIVKSSGKQLFINDSSCRPAIHSVIKGQNYITCYAENGIVWRYATDKEIKYESPNDLSGYTSNGDSIYLIEKVREYFTVPDEKVTCYAPNGKLSKMLFNTDTYFNTEKYPDE